MIEEKTNNIELIKSCFGALKPWLDKDMYFQMQDKEQSDRINSDYKSHKTSEDFTKEIDYIDEGDGIIIED